jgi:hypothetical protein
MAFNAKPTLRQIADAALSYALLFVLSGYPKTLRWV